MICSEPSGSSSAQRFITQRMNAAAASVRGAVSAGAASRHNIAPQLRVPQHGLYTADNPLAGLDSATKVALLERLEGYARAQDPRVSKVNASLNGSHTVVLVMRADGAVAADIRPLVRVNVSVVVGDGDGTVGVGYGKAKEVPAAIAKGVEEAKKNFFKVPRIQGTIPHPITGEAAAGVVLLRPAAPGTGVIAGGPVRAVLECAGIHDVLSKSLGSDNAINVVHATVAALKGLERPEEVAARRGLPLEDVAPAALLRARAAGLAGA